MNKSVRMGKNAPLNANRQKQYRGKAAAYQPERPDRLMVLIKEAAVILLCTLALFLALALVSYNPKDAGWSHTALEQGVHNAAGPTGAWMADVLFMMLGYFAYLFPVLLALKALQLFHNRRQGWVWNGWLLSWRLCGLLLLIISGSALAFTHFQPMAGMPASGGGVVGQVLGGLALAALNVQGSTLLFAVLFLFGLTLFADMSWFQILDVIGRLTLNLLGWSKRRLQGLMQGQLQRREERRQQDAERRSQLRQRLLDDESEIHLGNAAAIDEEAQCEAEASDCSDDGESDEIAASETEPTLRATEGRARHSLFDWQKPAGYQPPSLVDDDEPVFYNDLDDEDEPAIDWGKTRHHATAAEKPEPNPEPTLIPEYYDLDTKEPEQVLGVSAYYEQLTGQPMGAHPVAEHPADQPAAKHADEQPADPGYHDQLASKQPEQKSFVPGYYEQPIVKYAGELSHQMPSVPEYYQQLTSKPTADLPATPGSQSVNLSGQDDEELQLLRPPLGNAPGYANPSVVTHQPAPVASHAAPGLGAGAPLAQPHQGQHGAGQRDLPSLSLLDPVGEKKANYTAESLENISRLLEMRLKEFGVQVKVEEVHPGPVITRFEIQPAPGVKVSRIANLAKDLARSLAVYSVRVVEVIPGKTTVGIEIPNEDRQIVRLAEVLDSDVYRGAKSPVTLALGEDIGGNPVVADLAKMPHLLVAGTTGSGKSVGVNAMLLSILFKSTPEEARLIMIDPKMLELSVYEGIPHLLCPVVTDMKEAANALRWCVAEMERRYKLMAAMGVRNLAGFNRKLKEASQAGEPLTDPLYHSQDLDDEPPPLKALPTIVVVVDEFADMMMIVGKKVEELIARIAQKARAAGIHLILATQRPSVDVITGLIKANIPSRIAFQVSSKIDSRTILDQGGAEQLLGYGDMLYLPPGVGMPIRVHGAFVSDDEVHRVVEAWKEQGVPDYIDDILNANEEGSSSGGFDGGGEGSEEDPLYDEAVRFVTETRRASISSVQRKLKIGYNRAARMIEAMEMAGIVTPMSGNGSREVVAPAPIRD